MVLQWMSLKPIPFINGITNSRVITNRADILTPIHYPELNTLF